MVSQGPVEISPVQATERLTPDAAGLARAADLLRCGRLVAFGTETVYGLGADATDAGAVEAIFRAKGRPRHNPLIAHLPDAASALAEVEATDLARALARSFWPGPLTLVLTRAAGSRVCAAASAGLPSLAIRVPGSEAARALLARVGRPVVAPSANLSGRVSPSRAAHVLDPEHGGLDGRIAAVLDTGPCVVGLESTVLDLSGAAPVLLRPGGVGAEAIAAWLAANGAPALAERPAAASQPRAPGLLASHYAPHLPLRLDAARPEPDEAFLCFGEAPAHDGPSWNLSRGRDLAEAAARLFDGLRTLDAEGRRRGLRGIAVMSIPGDGLGRAIRDRLARAAAPRPAPAAAAPRPAQAASAARAGGPAAA